MIDRNLIRRHVSVSITLLLLSAMLGLMTYMLAHVYMTMSWHILDSLARNLVLSIRQTKLTEYMKVISWIGRWGIVGGWTIIAAILILKKRYSIFIICLAIALSGTLSGLAVKSLVHRERPTGESLVLESNYSFPSLHTLSVTIFTFTCVYLLYLETRSTIASFICELGAFFSIGLVGFSRIYLGVHYLSDVFAGLFLGLCVISGILGISKLIWILSYIKTQSRKV